MQDEHEVYCEYFIRQQSETNSNTNKRERLHLNNLNQLWWGAESVSVQCLGQRCLSPELRVQAEKLLSTAGVMTLITTQWSTLPPLTPEPTHQLLFLQVI